MGSTRPRVLQVVNNPAFFFEQHIPIALAAQERGYDVSVASPDWPGVADIRAAGFDHHAVRIRRGHINPVNESVALLDLVQLYRGIRPDLVHHITHKPILYGTIAARMAGVPAVLNANTGLGFMFIDTNAYTQVIRTLMRLAYAVGMRHPRQRDLYLNPDDRDEFVQLGMSVASNTAVVTGPGVDLATFGPSEEPTGTPVVALPARMLWHKGVAEFVEAARILRKRDVDVRMVLVGDTDPGNLAAVPAETLRSWHRDGVIEWWGYRSDMKEVYRSANVVVLPSYREGLGKVLIEAGACRRALIATNVAGCRQVVRHGENGLLVPVRNASRLADAIKTLVRDAALRARLADSARDIVEREFGIETICDQTIAYYDRLLERAPTQKRRGEKQDAVRVLEPVEVGEQQFLSA